MANNPHTKNRKELDDYLAKNKDNYNSTFYQQQKDKRDDTWKKEQAYDKQQTSSVTGGKELATKKTVPKKTVPVKTPDVNELMKQAKKRRKTK